MMFQLTRQEQWIVALIMLTLITGTILRLCKYTKEHSVPTSALKASAIQ